MDMFWRISHDADTTETGYFMRRTYVKTTWEGFPMQEAFEEDILMDFCFERFGAKTAYVQGVAPCPNWDISTSSDIEYEEAKPIIWGGTKTKTIKIELGIGNRGLTHILKEHEETE